MAHKEPIKFGDEEGWVTVASDDDITVGQRIKIGNAITDSISATYHLNSVANLKRVELEKELTAEERKAEAALSKEDQAQLKQWRAQVAELIALRDLPQAEQDAIGRHQRVRIQCYLKGWWKDEPIPSTDEDFDNMPGTLFDAIFAACSGELPDIPDVAATPDNQADPKVGTPA